MSEVVRKFTTGAVRDQDTDKLDFAGFICPKVWERYALYMHKHKLMADGSMRTSDNWKQGMPLRVYVSSLFRHFIELLLWKDKWGLHPKGERDPQDIEEVLCAMLFNVQGALREVIADRMADQIIDTEDWQ